METPVLAEAGKQLSEYFNGGRRSFNLPLAPSGTEFMCRVWNVLQQIPWGETRSYKEIAEMAGNSKACRAVGMANNRNPISIFIPCHRVIGAGGDLVGYGGGLEKTYSREVEKTKRGFFPLMPPYHLTTVVKCNFFDHISKLTDGKRLFFYIQ